MLPSCVRKLRFCAIVRALSSMSMVASNTRGLGPSPCGAPVSAVNPVMPSSVFSALCASGAIRSGIVV